MSESPERCQLYVSLDPGTFCEIAAAPVPTCTLGDVRCILLAMAGGASPGADLARAVAHIQETGIAVLVPGDSAMARDLGADGVHLFGDGAFQGDRSGAIEAARARLGPDAIVGANAGQSRHDAMLSGEAGADYVAFGPGVGGAAATPADQIGLIAWWAEIFEVACVAWAVPDTQLAIAFARAGADFVALDLASPGIAANAAIERIAAFTEAIRVE